jgi:hypothetical protein
MPKSLAEIANSRRFFTSRLWLRRDFVLLNPAADIRFHQDLPRACRRKTTKQDNLILHMIGIPTYHRDERIVTTGATESYQE